MVVAILLVGLFVIGLIVLAIFMQQANKSHEGNIEAKALASHSKLQREDPSNPLSELSDNEFKLHYKAAVKSRGIKTVLPLLGGFFAFLLFVMLGVVSSIESQSLTPLIIMLVLGLGAAITLGIFAIRQFRITGGEEWMLSETLRQAKKS